MRRGYGQNKRVGFIQTDPFHVNDKYILLDNYTHIAEFCNALIN